MADEQRLIDYTVPPLAYVDPAHILLFGTSGDIGFNVLASALVARQADGAFYADRTVAGNHTLAVRNFDASGAAASRLVLQTGGAGCYVVMDAVGASYRSVSNGPGIAPAYDYADQHYFMTRGGTLKMSLPDTSNAIFGAGAVWIKSDKMLLLHDGGNGYVRAETGNLYLGTAGTNRWQVTSSQFGATADNTYSICGASNRATVVYAATGSINTSDERLKRFRPGDALTEAELRAARRIAAELRFWQWIEEIDRKGEDKARWHFGPSAQTVARVLMDEGIEQAQDIDLPADQFVPEDQRPSFRTAFLCFDTWDAVYEDEYQDVPITDKVLTGETVSSILGLDGEPLRAPKFEQRERIERRPTGGKVLVTPAGNRFGLRVDQLCLFIAAAQEQRLAALEAA